MANGLHLVDGRLLIAGIHLLEVSSGVSQVEDAGEDRLAIKRQYFYSRPDAMLYLCSNNGASSSIHSFKSLRNLVQFAEFGNRSYAVGKSWRLKTR